MASLLTTPSSVTTPTGAAGPAAAVKDSAQKSLTSNYNDFLKLLMTQLQNQDPTSPMDTNQFTSQLVQYSSVEQQIATNTSLTQLIQLTQGGEVLQSSSLVGKPVTVTSDHIALQDGKGAVQFNTPSAETVSIGVYSDAGAKLRDAVVSSQPGHNAWSWDGRDNQGNVVPDGAYRTIVSGQTTGGAAQDLPFTVSGTATGVQKSGNALQVELGALKVDLSAVQSLAP
jgi:flagellar basal-body rod modification protein FlgD